MVTDVKISKKNKLIIILSIIFLLIIFLSSCEKNERPVANSIENHFNTVTTAEIRLSDFTSFEWDKVLVFNYYTSQDDIYTALGVNFTGSTDLTNGMIFVKDNEIVHYEYFDYDYNGIGRFMIYPNDQIGGLPRYRVFSADKAVFSGGKNVYDNGEVYYRFFPKFI